MKEKIICISKEEGNSIMDGFTVGKTYEIMFKQDKSPSYPKDGIDPGKPSYIVVDDENMPCMIPESGMWKHFSTIRNNNLNELGI